MVWNITSGWSLSSAALSEKAPVLTFATSVTASVFSYSVAIFPLNAKASQGRRNHLQW
jgi:hypothetical protein